jgi:hypothetical protein
VRWPRFSSPDRWTLADVEDDVAASLSGQQRLGSGLVAQPPLDRLSAAAAEACAGCRKRAVSRARTAFRREGTDPLLLHLRHSAGSTAALRPVANTSMSTPRPARRSPSWDSYLATHRPGNVDRPHGDRQCQPACGTRARADTGLALIDQELELGVRSIPVPLRNSTVINIVCDGFRASNLPQPDGSRRQKPQTAELHRLSMLLRPRRATTACTSLRLVNGPAFLDRLPPRTNTHVHLISTRAARMGQADRDPPLPGTRDPWRGPRAGRGQRRRGPACARASAASRSAASVRVVLSS